MKRIPFNQPYNDKSISDSLSECLELGRFSGDGKFTKDCSALMENSYSSHRVLLTTSCTHALEMSAILADINVGDEIIMPSYTFVSTANAFVLRGAKIVFVDIRPDTMNIDEKLIEAAITSKTKAIVPVHYSGVACEMDVICEIAAKYGLIVIEDAAQGVNAKYKNKFLGSIGQLGCFSFHETKNFHCGEGGALLINDKRFAERAEIIREKGTDRSRFFRGQVDKYTWQDLGSSYLISELNAAFLYPQLKEANKINNDRIASWNRYYSGLKGLQEDGFITLPVVPSECEHNAHMFYLKVKDNDERSKLIEFLNSKNINSIFHYIPLHTSPAGLKFGRFHGDDHYTTKESERLLRLPLYYGIEKSDVDRVIENVGLYFYK